MTLSRVTRFSFFVCLVSALYFLTRAGDLGRDLASEEAVFLMPGRFLLEGRGYYFDWGVFDPHSNAFSKSRFIWRSVTSEMVIRDTFLSRFLRCSFCLGFVCQNRLASGKS